MTAKIKTILLIVFFACFSFAETQAQRVFTIDFCIFDEDNAPFSYGDTIPLIVHVIVQDTLGTDTSAFGDLYYWFQTDSMMLAGVPPRLINTDLSLELVPPGGIIDTVSVDLIPDEWRTGPVNVYCVWAGMYIPDCVDTIPCCNSFGVVILGDENISANASLSLYPNPTHQLLFITSAQINSISAISIMTMDGKISDSKSHDEIKNGFIDLEFLLPGIYIVELKMLDNSIVRRKIQKQ